MSDNPAITALIVDDESLARKLVTRMLTEHSDIELLAECENGLQAVEAIATLKPQLVFLDIKMPGLDGFELLEKIDKRDQPYIVFITAYDQYALDAFKVHALDYLMKPFDQERFDQTIDRVRKQIFGESDADFGRRFRSFLESNAIGTTAPQEEESETPINRLVVKDRGKIFFLNPEDVDWFEASGNYVSLMVGPKTHMIHETLTKMEQKLDPLKFLRIHRSTIVNIDRIKELQPHFNGEYIVILNTGKKLKLSRNYREKANEVLGLA